MNCKKQWCASRTSDKQAPEKSKVTPKDSSASPEEYTGYLLLHCGDVRALTQAPGDKDWQRAPGPVVPPWLLVTDVMRLQIPSWQNFSTSSLHAHFPMILKSKIGNKSNRRNKSNTGNMELIVQAGNSLPVLMKMQINGRGTKSKY